LVVVAAAAAGATSKAEGVDSSNADGDEQTALDLHLPEAE